MAAVAGARTAIGDSTATAWQKFLEITDVTALEAEAEARRAYRLEQGRPWFQRNPTGADAVAAATNAADTARERVAEPLLAARLKQLHERSAVTARKPAPWTERLPGLAARLLDGDATGAVIA